MTDGGLPARPSRTGPYTRLSSSAGANRADDPSRPRKVLLCAGMPRPRFGSRRRTTSRFWRLRYLRLGALGSRCRVWASEMRRDGSTLGTGLDGIRFQRWNCATFKSSLMSFSNSQVHSTHGSVDHFTRYNVTVSSGAVLRKSSSSSRSCSASRVAWSALCSPCWPERRCRCALFTYSVLGGSSRKPP